MDVGVPDVGLTRADVDAALERHLVEGGRLGEKLIALGLLTGISI
jgi:hypothetical protein